MSRAVLFALASRGTVSAHKATIKIIGEHTGGFAQGHFEYDAKQSGSTTLSDLRFGLRPIRSTYRIQRAHLVPRSVWIAGGDGWAVIMYSLFEEQRIAEQLAAHRFIDGWKPRRHGT